MTEADKRTLQIAALVSREMADTLSGRGNLALDAIAKSLRKSAKGIDAEVGALPVLAPPTEAELATVREGVFQTVRRAVLMSGTPMPEVLQ